MIVDTNLFFLQKTQILLIQQIFKLYVIPCSAEYLARVFNFTASSGADGFAPKWLVCAPCWKQSTGYIPEDLQARHVKYVLNQNQNQINECLF